MHKKDWEKRWYRMMVQQSIKNLVNSIKGRHRKKKSKPVLLNKAIYLHILLNSIQAVMLQKKKMQQDSSKDTNQEGSDEDHNVKESGNGNNREKNTEMVSAERIDEREVDQLA